jgi:hypothetical protein
MLVTHWLLNTEICFMIGGNEPQIFAEGKYDNEIENSVANEGN